MKKFHMKLDGLITDPNPYGAAPAGQMNVASNVVFRRDGVASPRPGFKDAAAGGTPPASHEVKAIVPYDGDRVVWSSSGGNYRTDWLSDFTQVTGDEDPGQPNRLGVRTEKARGNLYVATGIRPQKITSSSDNAWEDCDVSGRGFSFIGTGISSDGGVDLETGGATWAYRALLRREDAGGYIVRSSPSARFVFSSGLTGQKTLNPWLTQVPLSAIAGDVIEIYRTRVLTGSSTADPGDEMFLAFEQELTSANLTTLSGQNILADVVVLEDNTANEALGAALYTNPSQEGIEQSNDRVQEATDLALYRGSMFYAGPSTALRLQIAITDVGGNNTDGQETDTGLQERGFTADIPASGTTLSNVSDFSGLVVGMLLDDGTTSEILGSAGTFFAANTKISVLNPGGSTITLDTAVNATAGSVTHSITAHDVVEYGTNEYYANQAMVSTTASFPFNAEGGTDAGVRLRATAESLAIVMNKRESGFRVDNVYSDVSEAGLVLEFEDVGAATEALTSTRPNAFDPPLGSAGLFPSLETVVGAIRWSKTDLPEAVPELNYAVVGDSAKAILRLVPTEEALYIFKEDGLFRLTGFGAAVGWRIDPLDPSLILIAPESPAVLEGNVWCYTNRGIGYVDASGFHDVSGPYIDNQLTEPTEILAALPSTIDGAVGAVDSTEHEYMLALTWDSPVLDEGIPTTNNKMYVFNTKTRSWATWDLAAQALAYDDDADRVYLALASYDVRSGRKSEVYPGADREYAVTISGQTANVVSFSGVGSWTAAVGDAVRQGSVIGIVTDVTSFPTSVTVDISTGFTAAAATAYEAFASEVELLVFSEPTEFNQWQLVLWAFRYATNVNQYDQAFSSDATTTSASSSTTVTKSAGNAPFPLRQYVPRNFSMAGVIFSKLTITAALSDWALASLTATYETIGETIRRDYA